MSRDKLGRFVKKELDYSVSGQVVYVAIWNKGNLFKGIFDFDDLELLKSLGGLFLCKKYVCCRGDYGAKKTAYVSRIIMNCPEGMVVDHINGNPLDNRKSNLRVVTQYENCQNRPTLNKNNSTGISGVIGWRYYASTVVNGKRNHIGSFSTLEEAISAIEKVEGRTIRKANKSNKVGYRGIYPVKPKAWIYIDGKRKYIGSFDSIEEAEAELKKLKNN